MLLVERLDSVGVGGSEKQLVVDSVAEVAAVAAGGS